jgi:hypothetical protein
MCATTRRSAPTTSAPSGPVSLFVSASEVREACRRILTSTWRESDGFCPPNPTVYPHQWLWDSCFHAIAWSALSDDRGARELATCFRGQFASGFMPHMRYLGLSTSRGPLPDRSSFTQPPIYAHALRVVASGRSGPMGEMVTAAERALDWLWRHRRTDDGLIYIVHPWESGADDSPRWDSWVGVEPYDKPAFRVHDRQLVDQTQFDELGAAVWSREFVVAPSAFNAFVAHAAGELGALTGNDRWTTRARELADAADRLLWDDDQGLWVDSPVVGGGSSCRIPTLDGIFGALVTADTDKANRALAQLSDPSRFAAPYGLAYLPRGHPTYDPGSYWRGPAWPQLNYMMALAAARWEHEELRRQIADWSVRAAQRSNYAEYWNPETGVGLGAIPQGWAALAATYTE